MANIIIDESKCSKCNICQKVCSFGLIDAAGPESFPSIPKAKQAYCFKCGHCVAFCKSKAIKLDSTNHSANQVLTDLSEMNAQQLKNYISLRRSIRHYKDQSVDKELILDLLNTVRYAPSGGNSQNVEWLVIYSKDQVKKIAGLTIEWMKSIMGTAHPMAGYISPVVQMWDAGIDFISHDAPHLLIAHIPVSPFIEDTTDGIIALTHFDILTPAFGLGCCWAGFIKMAIASYEPVRKAVGLKEDRLVAYPILFGYPSYKAYQIPERNDLKVEWK